MATNVDVRVRQVLGNTGAVGAEEAIRAANVIKRNTASGLYPTTGGAVSLMDREDVDTLHRAYRGLFSRFRPRMPDRGDSPAKSLSDWYVAAIEQALFHGDIPFDRRQATAMDGFLHTYHSRGVDWKRIHAFATSLDATVSPFGQGQDWTRGSEPMGVSAFVGINS